MMILVKYLIGCFVVWFLSYTVYYNKMKSVVELFGLRMKDNYFVYVFKHFIKFYKFLIPGYNVGLLIKVCIQDLSELKDFSIKSKKFLKKY